MAGGDDLWIVGVVLVLAGSIGQNLGNNLMSLGHEQQRQLDSVKKVTEKAESEENKDNDDTIAARADIESGVAKAEGEKMEDKEEEKGTWWFIGTVCFVVGSLSTFVAFGFGAQSLLAALESIQFVTNVIFAKTVHNEAVTVRMLLSTTAIVLGCVLVVVFSPHGDSTLTGEDVQRLLIKTPFIIWIVFSFIGWCCAEYTYLYYKKARLVEGRRLWKHSMIEPLCYCLASALVGALAVVGAKCLSMLIIYHPDVEFVKPTVYITLFVWLGLVFYWLRRLDYGFELYPPLFVIPVIQCFFIFLAIVAGGIFYEEFAKFTGPQYGGFFTGVVIILAGVYGLAPTDVDTMVVPVTYDVDAELAKLENEKISGTPAEGPTAFATGISAVDNSAEAESLIDEKRQAMEGDTNLFSKPTTGDAESVTKSSRKIVKRGDSLAQ